MQPEGFPGAPWTLQGEAMIAFKLVRTARVRHLIPKDATALSIWPGRTLAILYIAQYRQSPVGSYSEVIVAPAVIWRQGRIGCWISQIVVDNERSLAAGRAIWALPKRAARIQWRSRRRTKTSDERMRVSVGGPEMSLRAAFTSAARSLRLPFIGAAMSMYDGVTRWFAVRGMARIGLTRAALETDDRSIRELGFCGSLTVCVCTGMRITIGRPSVYHRPSIPPL